MATFKLRANELTGETGLSVYLYPVGGTIANSGGDTLTESSGLFTATVAESLSGLHDYFIYQGGLSIYRGLVFCSGSTWIADDFSWVTSKTDALPSDPADQSVLAGLLATVSSTLTEVESQTSLITSAGIVQVEETTTTIRLKTGSTKAKTVTVDEDLSGKTLKLFVTTMDHVFFAEISATGADGSFTFTPTTALTAKNRDYIYALREPSDGNRVVDGAQGLIEVDFAPDEE